MFPTMASKEIELETLVIPGGGIIIPVPSADELEPRESRSRHCENRGDWQDYVSGHKGAAAAIRLDSFRTGGSQNPIGTLQLLDLLRNAGHRVEQLNARLFWVDGKTAALADLVEKAREIDADTVFVADAA